MRGLKTVPGGMICTVVVAFAPAERFRPSEGATSALVATYAAEIGSFGRLWNVPDTTKSFGNRYEARNLTCVSHGVSWWQNGMISGEVSGRDCNTSQASA